MTTERRPNGTNPDPAGRDVTVRPAPRKPLYYPESHPATGIFRQPGDSSDGRFPYRPAGTARTARTAVDGALALAASGPGVVSVKSGIRQPCHQPNCHPEGALPGGISGSNVARLRDPSR